MDEPLNTNVTIRHYLDANIMPTLVEALDKLTSEKPEDPIQFIGEYMLRDCEKEAHV